MTRLFLLWGSVNAFLSVALGAFGAHGLKARLPPEMLDIYKTGVLYHQIHALGLILLALLAERLTARRLAQWSGWLLMAGIVLFPGSLYALSISGVRTLGAITPLGGVCFLSGWALLALAAMRQSK